MAGEQLNDVQTGDVAEAWNVQTHTDLIKGKFGYPVKYTKHSSPTIASLALANRSTDLSAPILELYANDLLTLLMRVTNSGMTQAKVGGFFDFKYQSVAPAAPGVGTQTIRMYARAGQFYFKVEGSAEQQIPVGAPPGPSMRYAFWMG